MFMSKQIVAKANALIKGSYRLSLTEMRLIIYGISLINTVKKDFPLLYKINIKRFTKMFNIKNKDVYHDLKSVVLGKFWERDFSYIDEEGNAVAVRWLTKVRYHDKRGFLEIKFSEDLQPLLHQLKKNFTVYYIEQIANFKSIYGVRIYELCLMNFNRHKGAAINKERLSITFKINIKDFQQTLEIGNKYYKRFPSFKVNVLEKARTEINNHSDLIISYEVIKEGRTPYEIVFKVKRKSGQKKKEKLIDPKQARILELKNLIAEQKHFVDGLICQENKAIRKEAEKKVKQYCEELIAIEK